LVAVTSPNLIVALENLTIRQMALHTPPREGLKVLLATRAARAANSGPRAAAQTMASPAVYTRALLRKAAIRPGAAMAAMMSAHVSCGRVSQAFLATWEPERRGWEDSGVSQVTRG
jgi:hypothetical protein